MAQVTGKTAAYMDGVVASTVKSGYVRADNHLILVLHDDSEIDAGLIQADAATLTAAQAYADQAETDAVAAAATYTDQAEADAISAANAYSDAALAAQVAIINERTVGQELDGTVNLNDLTTPGVYWQSHTADTDFDRNYPIELAGLVEVWANGVNMVWQRYTPYGFYAAGGSYVRAKYNTTWYPWKDKHGFTIPINHQPKAGFEELTAGFTIPHDTSRTLHPNDWMTYELLSTASAKVVDATADGFTPPSGSKCLGLYAPTSGRVRIQSPTFDVVPGRTYVSRFKVGRIGNTTGRLYFRVAGGSTTALTEKPGASSSTGIHDIGSIENWDPPQIGTLYTNADASLMETKSLIFTPPAGIVKAALSFVNYDPTGSVTMVFDDFEVLEIVGSDQVYDTGWIDANLQNGWANYPSTPYDKCSYRRIGERTEIQGMVSGGTATVGTTLFAIPAEWSPSRRKMMFGYASGGALGRWDIQNTGNVSTQAGFSASYTSLGHANFTP